MPQGANYRWRKSARSRGDVQAVGVVLERLRKQNKGELTAEIVLKEAKKKKSPLHASFEWNDTEAARIYRMNQARNLIRDIEITIPEGKTSHLYVLVESGSQNVYTTTQSALEDSELRQQILDRAWREARLWVDRYNHLEELAGIVAVIRKGKAE